MSKLTTEGILNERKKQIRDAIREYPTLYYSYKKYIKECNGSWFSASDKLLDKYEEMKDPIKYMQDYERRERINTAHAARETQAELREWQLSRRDGAVQCPYCKSWDTEAISTASRVASVALVGIASNKIGKNYHCNKCGANF